MHDHQSREVRDKLMLRDLKRVMGIIDQLDRYVTDVSGVCHEILNTFAQRIGAAKAAIFVADDSVYERTSRTMKTNKLLSRFKDMISEDSEVQGEYSNKQSMFVCAAQNGLGEEAERHTFSCDLKNTFITDACSAEPFSVTDVYGEDIDDDYMPGLQACGLEGYGLFSWIPLYDNMEKRLLALVGFDCKEFSPEDQSYIEWLMPQCLRALRSAVWYGRMSNARVDLERQIEKLSTLYDVGKALNDIDDRNKLLRDILQYAAQIANAQKGSIMLLEDSPGANAGSGAELVVSVVYGIDPDIAEKISRGEVKTKRFKIGEGIAGQVAQSKKPIVINNTSKSAKFVSKDTSNVSSILCVPLIVHEDLLGVLNITNKSGNAPFTSDDLQIIQQVAEQAAVAIHNAHLYELAVTDGLTKVFIRRHFFAKFADEIKRVLRSNSNLSLIMLDIDFFKAVNDTYGHQCGDYVLSEVAMCLRGTLRDVDILGRYGGEEFAVVLIDSNAEGARRAANRIQNTLENHKFIWNNSDEEDAEPLELRISVSIGIACYPQHASSQSELMRYADAAMYYSKHTGRNRSTIYNEKVQEFMEDAKAREAEAAEAASHR